MPPSKVPPDQLQAMFLRAQLLSIGQQLGRAYHVDHGHPEYRHNEEAKDNMVKVLREWTPAVWEGFKGLWTPVDTSCMRVQKIVYGTDARSAYLALDLDQLSTAAANVDREFLRTLPRHTVGFLISASLLRSRNGQYLMSLQRGLTGAEGAIDDAHFLAAQQGMRNAPGSEGLPASHQSIAAGGDPDGPKPAGAESMPGVHGRTSSAPPSNLSSATLHQQHQQLGAAIVGNKSPAPSSVRASASGHASTGPDSVASKPPGISQGPLMPLEDVLQSLALQSSDSTIASGQRSYAFRSLNAQQLPQGMSSLPLQTAVAGGSQAMWRSQPVQPLGEYNMQHGAGDNSQLMFGFTSVGSAAAVSQSSAATEWLAQQHRDQMLAPLQQPSALPQGGDGRGIQWNPSVPHSGDFSQQQLAWQAQGHAGDAGGGGRLADDAGQGSQVQPGWDALQQWPDSSSRPIAEAKSMSNSATITALSCHTSNEWDALHPVCSTGSMDSCFQAPHEASCLPMPSLLH